MKDHIIKRVCCKKSRGLKAQSVIESILIIAIAVFILTALIAITFDQIYSFKDSQNKKIASLAINSIIDEVNDLYFLGPGSVKTILVVLPEGIDPEKSFIQDRTLWLNVWGSDVFASASVDVRGEWPIESGNYAFTLTSFDDFVLITTSLATVSPTQVSEYLLQGQGIDFNVELFNESTLTKSYSIILDFPIVSSSEVSLLNEGGVSEVSVLPSDSSLTNFSLNCSMNSFGSYSGKIVFVPLDDSDLNITIPINLFCSSLQSKLKVYPSTKNSFVIINSTSTESILACNTTNRDFDSTKVSIIGDISPFVLTSFTEGILANSCSSIPLIINSPLSVSTTTGSLLINSGGYDSLIEFNLLAIDENNALVIDWSNAYFSEDYSSIRDINLFVIAGDYNIVQAKLLVLNDLDDSNIFDLKLNDSLVTSSGEEFLVGEWFNVSEFNLSPNTIYSLDINFDSNVFNDSEKFRLILRTNNDLYFWSPIFDPTNSIVDNTTSHFANLSKGQEPIYPRNENLVALWRMNDKNSDGWILNSITGERDGKLNGDADVSSNGLWDKNAVNFDGLGDYIDISINIPATVTISAWAKSSATILDDMLWCLNNAWAGGPDLYFNSGLIMLNTWDATNNSFCSQPNVNEWHLYTTIIDAVANDAKLYVDGNLCGTAAYKNPTKTSIAISSSNGYDWQGQIDDVAIWDTALSAEDVEQIYSIGSGEKNFGTVVDGNGVYLDSNEDGFLSEGVFYSRLFEFGESVDFEKIFLRGENLGGGLFSSRKSFSGVDLDYSNSSLVSKRYFGDAIVATGELDWNSDGNYSVNGSSWDLNLKAYYKFNSKEGTTIYDSAREYNGVLTGGSDVNGVGLWDSNAAWFDGSTGYVLINPYVYDGNNITISAWIYPTTLSGERAILSSNGFMFETNGSLLRLYTNIYSGGTANSTLTVNLNQWNYVAVTFTNPGGLTNNLVTFYINGNRESVSLDNYLKSTTFIRIGNYFGGNRFFEGLIDEVKLYNRVLSFEELDADYNSFLNAKLVSGGLIRSGHVTDWNSFVINSDVNYSFGREICGVGDLGCSLDEFNDGLVGLWHFNNALVDSSGNNFNGTWAGSEEYLTGLWGTNSANFDGTTDYIAIPSINTGAGTGLTGCGWVKRFGALNNLAALFSFNNLKIRFTSDGRISDRSYAYAGGNSEVYYSYNSIPLNKWTLVCVTYSSTGSNIVMDFYFDGLLDRSIVTDLSGLVGINSGGYIGMCQDSSSRKFSGFIEEASIWNRKLSNLEIINLYRKGISRLDLNVYSCSDESCVSKLGFEYFSDVNNGVLVELSESIVDSNYLGLDAYFKKASGFEDYNSGTFFVGSFVKDINFSFTTLPNVFVCSSSNGYSWSDWVDLNNSLIQDLSLVDGNYLQYKSNFYSLDSSITPVLSDVNITYTR